MDLREIGWGGVWSGFTWLRIGNVGGVLWMRWWTFGFWRHAVSHFCTGFSSFFQEVFILSLILTPCSHFHANYLNVAC
jgi:hypothetical protein